MYHNVKTYIEVRLGFAIFKPFFFLFKNFFNLVKLKGGIILESKKSNFI